MFWSPTRPFLEFSFIIRIGFLVSFSSWFSIYNRHLSTWKLLSFSWQISSQYLTSLHLQIAFIMLSLLQYSHVPVASCSLLSYLNTNEACLFGRYSSTYISIFVLLLEAIYPILREEVNTDSRHTPGNFIPVFISICSLFSICPGIPWYKLITFRTESIELSIVLVFLLN